MPDPLEELIQAVQVGAAYRAIAADVVQRIAGQELAKGRGFKETVKAVRNKLHQVGGAYQEQAIPYPRLLGELDSLPRDPQHPEVHRFCRKVMALHASTRERLPILDRFYAEALAPIGLIRSVMDLACGLNPLALPWMPLAPGAELWGCDIYLDLVAFLNPFYQHLGLNGKAFTCDLAVGAPPEPAQLVLLLKTIPCLEQIDKTAGERLLVTIQAEHILVSFPAKSLGGYSKGMVENYEAHFRQLLEGKNWTVRRFEFASELAFLLSQ